MRPRHGRDTAAGNRGHPRLTAGLTEQSQSCRDGRKKYDRLFAES